MSDYANDTVKRDHLISAGNIFWTAVKVNGSTDMEQWCVCNMSTTVSAHVANNHMRRDDILYI